MIDGDVWGDSDRLKKIQHNQLLGIAMTWSRHARPITCITTTIALRHFWVEMSVGKKTPEE